MKKSRSIAISSAPPAKQPPVPSTPPVPIVKHVDVMRCSKCGEEVGEDYRFCHSCGQVISPEEKLAAKDAIKVQELEGKLYYYQGRMMRGIFVSSLGVFWMLVILYTPLVTTPGAAYYFVVSLLGIIYFFPSFLYSGLRVVLLKRTLKKNFISWEVEQNYN